MLHGPGDLRIERRDLPPLGSHDVMVQVSHCGVCGTDLHMTLEGWARPGSVGGHEWSGQVVEAGADVTGVRVGDAVVGGPGDACGTCRQCLAGRPSICERRDQPGSTPSNGAFAEVVVTAANSVVPVPDGLDLRVAALAEPFAVALHAVTNSGAEAGQRAFVSGGGSIGLLSVLALRRKGVEEITLCEPNPLRRALADRLGVTTTVPDELDVPNMAEPRRLVDRPVDVAIETSGKAVAAPAALAQLDRAGRLVLVGSGMEPVALDPNRVLLNELVVTGAFEHDAGGIDLALDLLAAGAVDDSVVTEPGSVGLDGLLDAMHGLAGGSIAGKVLTTPNRGAVR